MPQWSPYFAGVNLIMLYFHLSRQWKQTKGILIMNCCFQVLVGYMPHILVRLQHILDFEMMKSESHMKLVPSFLVPFLFNLIWPQSNRFWRNKDFWFERQFVNEYILFFLHATFFYEGSIYIALWVLYLCLIMEYGPKIQQRKSHFSLSFINLKYEFC